MSKPPKPAAEPASTRCCVSEKAPAGCRTILVEKTDRLYRNIKDYATLDEFDVDYSLGQRKRNYRPGFAIIRAVRARHQGLDGPELQPELG